MKNVALNFIIGYFVISGMTLKAQDTLVYFDRVDASGEELSTFPDYWQGVYRNENGVTWEVENKKIVTVSNLFLSFTKAELEEKENYQLNNGYLFGFVEEDSIPVLERNDSVYFAYTHKKELFQIRGDDQVLTKEGQSLYFYESKKEDVYTLVKFSLDKGTFKVAYPNYELLVKEIDNFKRKTQLIKDNSSESSYFLVKNIKANFEILTTGEFFETALELKFLEKL